MYTTGKWARRENEPDADYERRVNGPRLGLAKGRAASAETRARQAAERHAQGSQQADPQRKPRRSASDPPRASQDTRRPSLQLRPPQDSGDDATTTNAKPSQATAAIPPLTQQL